MVNKTSRSRRYLITKNSILMLVMLVVIFLAVWAWYLSADTPAVASGLTVSAEGPSKVQLALPKNGGCPDDDDFQTEINFTEDYTVRQLLYRDITSDGFNFIIPTFEAEKDNMRDGRRVVPGGKWTDGKSTKQVLSNESAEDDEEYHYVSQDFYLRAPKAEVSVTSRSYLASQSDLDNKPLAALNKASVENNNELYGNGLFSCDAIIGAVRVSLTGQPLSGYSISGKGTENETRQDTLFGSADTEPRFLWVPRPDICLNTADSYDDFNLATGILPTNSNYVEKTYRHSFYVRENASNQNGVRLVKYYDSDIAKMDGVPDSYTLGATTKSYFHVSNNVTAANTATGQYPTLGKDCEVTSDVEQPQIEFESSQGETSEYYVYKMTLNLWIEGEDAEARRAMGNGLFKLFLEFK